MTEATDQIQHLATSKVANMTTRQLVDAFEETNRRGHGVEISTVRGWLMDELEARDREAFDRWLFSTADSPRRYYLTKAS